VAPEVKAHMGWEEQHPNLPDQPIIALGQMLSLIAAMRDQAEANREFLGELTVQTQRQISALEQLAAREAAVASAQNPSAWAGVTAQNICGRRCAIFAGDI